MEEKQEQPKEQKSLSLREQILQACMKSTGKSREELEKEIDYFV